MPRRPQHRRQEPRIKKSADVVAPQPVIPSERKERSDWRESRNLPSAMPRPPQHRRQEPRIEKGADVVAPQPVIPSERQERSAWRESRNLPSAMPRPPQHRRQEPRIKKKRGCGRPPTRHSEPVEESPKPTTSVVRSFTACPGHLAPTRSQPRTADQEQSADLPTRHSERAPGAQRLARVEESPVCNAQTASASPSRTADRKKRGWKKPQSIPLPPRAPMAVHPARS